jgi:hypothetical protein
MKQSAQWFNCELHKSEKAYLQGLSADLNDPGLGVAGPGSLDKLQLRDSAAAKPQDRLLLPPYSG